MYFLLFFFFFKQKTAYEMRISDWSSDVCSSDLHVGEVVAVGAHELFHDILQALARRPRGFFEYADALLDVRLHAAAEAFAEQFFLAAEIIINGGAIEAGLEPDLGKLGGAIALRLELKIGRASCRERGCQ